MNLLDPIEGVPLMDWSAIPTLLCGAVLLGAALVLLIVLVASAWTAAARKIAEWRAKR